MKKLMFIFLAWSLSQTTHAREPQEDCSLVALQAATYMEERQGGKKRKAMTFSTQGIWPRRLKKLYREIINDAHQERLASDPQIRQMVVNSFQEKWYRECVKRSPEPSKFAR